MCVYKTMSPDFYFFSKFELRHKITWLASAWLPWQLYKKRSFVRIYLTHLPPKFG